MTEADEFLEEDLPIKSDKFSDNVIRAVDDFIEDHNLGESRFDKQLSKSKMRDGLYTRVFNEIMAMDVPRDMLNGADQFDDPQIFVHLLKQIEDESKHARLLSQRLSDLDGDPSHCFTEASVSSLWDGYREKNIVEQAATLQAAGERMAKARHPNELKYYDEETAEVYENVIVPEEQFHAKIGANILRNCNTKDAQRTALDQVRAVLSVLASHNEGNAADYTTQ